MGYKNTRECLEALEARGELVRIDKCVDANLEIGAIQRRVFKAGGPALMFNNVKGCRFPMAANIYGTRDRMRFIFRDTIAMVERLMRLKLSPLEALKRPWAYLGAPRTAYHTLPKRTSDGPILRNRTTVSKLPQLVSWPMDGGGYVTLPQVYTEDPGHPGFAASNMGMYRVQLSGNDYAQDKEVGLHYQIHRGIGHHHARAIAKGEPLKVNVFVGGPPAMTLAAVMPLPEGLPELFFAGAMAGHRIPMVRHPGGLPMPAQADFCICGTVEGVQKSEGPFGDHLGYYSLAPRFSGAQGGLGLPPRRRRLAVHHGGPSTPGGHHLRRVHPRTDRGFGAVGLFRGARGPRRGRGGRAPVAPGRGQRALRALCGRAPAPGAADQCPVPARQHPDLAVPSTCSSRPARTWPPGCPAAISRASSATCWPGRTCPATCISSPGPPSDTLDYSGISLNQGSKLVFAAAGEPRRELGVETPSGLDLPRGYRDPQVFAPGILVIKGPKHRRKRDQQDPALERLGESLKSVRSIEKFPLIVVADDAGFTAADWDNFLWVTFTRSDPATDIYGVGAFTHAKHWGSGQGDPRRCPAQDLPRAAARTGPRGGKGGGCARGQGRPASRNHLALEYSMDQKVLDELKLAFACDLYETVKAARKKTRRTCVPAHHDRRGRPDGLCGHVSEKGHHGVSGPDRGVRCQAPHLQPARRDHGRAVRPGHVLPGRL